MGEKRHVEENTTFPPTEETMAAYHAREANDDAGVFLAAAREWDTSVNVKQIEIKQLESNVERLESNVERLERDMKYHKNFVISRGIFWAIALVFSVVVLTVAASSLSGRIDELRGVTSAIRLRVNDNTARLNDFSMDPEKMKESSILVRSETDPLPNSHPQDEKFEELKKSEEKSSSENKMLLGVAAATILCVLLMLTVYLEKLRKKVKTLERKISIPIATSSTQ